MNHVEVLMVALALLLAVWCSFGEDDMHPLGVVMWLIIVVGLIVLFILTGKSCFLWGPAKP